MASIPAKGGQIRSVENGRKRPETSNLQPPPLSRSIGVRSTGAYVARDAVRFGPDSDLIWST
eukprot:692864-Pyramimonas_sp.AAC.1